MLHMRLPKGWKCSDESDDRREALKAKERAEAVIETVQSREADVDKLVSHFVERRKQPSIGSLLFLSTANRGS